MSTADDLLARRPDLATAIDAYRKALRAGPLDDELLDRCALLVQRLIARTAEPGAGGGGFADRRRRSPTLARATNGVGESVDARTSAVLTFAEQFVIDPHGIDDAVRDDVLDHLAPAELAVLVQWLAITDGLARLSTVLAGVGT